jgi:hypothetical protein
MVKITAELPARLGRGKMVIKKMTASFGVVAKPQESHQTVDVCDVEGLCDAIEDLVRKRRRSPSGSGDPPPKARRTNCNVPEPPL